GPAGDPARCNGIVRHYDGSVCSRLPGSVLPGQKPCTWTCPRLSVPVGSQVGLPSPCMSRLYSRAQGRGTCREGTDLATGRQCLRWYRLPGESGSLNAASNCFP